MAASASAVDATPSPSSGHASATARAGEQCPGGVRPANGIELAVTDPDFSVWLPADWEPLPLPEYLEQLESVGASINDPRFDELVVLQRGRIQSGTVRAMGTGTAPGGAVVYVAIEVVPMAGDLESTAEAVLASYAPTGVTAETEFVAPTDLPVGPSVCASYVIDMDVGVPSRTTLFSAMLPSGEVASVYATAPTEDTEFPLVVRSIAQSLEAR